MSSSYPEFEIGYHRSVFTQLGETRQTRAAQRLEQKMLIEVQMMEYSAQQTKITDLPVPGIKDRLKVVVSNVKSTEVKPGRKFR